MIDIREEIRSAPVGRYHQFVALLVSAVVFCAGYDQFNSAYVIHYVLLPWHLLPSQAGLLISSSLIGFMVGALAQGKLADRYGRRAAVLAGLWISTIFSLATALFARSFVTFCAFRFLTGIGIGTLLPLCITYANEYAPRRVANTFPVLGWVLGWSASGVGAAVIGVFLTPIFGWRSLYYAASLSIVVVVVCHVMLPESLQFLAMRGQNQDISKVLSRLNPSQASRYKLKGEQFIFPEPSDRSGSFVLLLSGNYQRMTIALWASAFFILFGVWGLNGWVPTAMIQRGETFVTSFSFGALIHIMGFLGALLCGYIADQRGSVRGPLVTWLLLGAVSVINLAVFNNHMINLVCTSVAGFCILGGQSVLNNFTAAAYDTEVRGTGVGMMLGVGRVGGILGPYVAGLLQQIIPETSGIFISIGVAVLLGASTMVFARPVRLGRVKTHSAGILGN